MHISLKTIWRTQKDTQVCPVCNALEGYTWTTEADDIYPKKLIHPVYGPVYDTRPAAKRSLVNEEKGHICRCTLEHQLELSASKDKNAVANGNEKQPENKIVQE